jgi:hypothetical protein
MKRLLVVGALVAVSLGAWALGTGAVQAVPCRKLGGGANWCRRCPPPAPGCTLFECSKCGCDYSCPIEPTGRGAMRFYRVPVRSDDNAL